MSPRSTSSSTPKVSARPYLAPDPVSAAIVAGQKDVGPRRCRSGPQRERRDERGEGADEALHRRTGSPRCPTSPADHQNAAIEINDGRLVQLNLGG